MKMNKKNIKLITSIALSVAVVVSALLIFVIPGNSVDILDDGVRREGSPLDNGLVYIDPSIVALAGELNGSPETQAAAKAAFDQINTLRAARGLKAYKWNSGLEQAASVRAIEASQVWAHTRPNGTEYWTVNEAIVYGENLAKGYFNGDSVVQGWVNSPTHLANILDGEFRTAGISVHMVGDQWYWANEFGY